ncbi:DNA cytosine methyltransferase [Curtobacterium sp. VKM Ac-2884]|nr:DNA cytosine methyltransferase [Curtobacterium sp. VKM Ac-2884]
MGLESAGFRVAWANDYEPDKWDLYRGHFNDPEGGGHSFALGDVGAVGADQLPRDAKLAWGSSPCTDLSLAGSRGGLRAGESNAFWQYIRLLDELGDDRPEVAVLENVVGLATSHGGDDLAAAIRAFAEGRSRPSARAIDVQGLVGSVMAEFGDDDPQDDSGDA